MDLTADGTSLNACGVAALGRVVISGGKVSDSVLFSGVRLEDDATVEKSILFEDVRIGSRARLRNCIVDKGVEIPPGELVGHDLVKDRQRFTVTENGTVVVPHSHAFSSGGTGAHSK